MNWTLLQEWPFCKNKFLKILLCGSKSVTEDMCKKVPNHGSRNGKKLEHFEVICDFDLTNMKITLNTNYTTAIDKTFL